MTRRENLFEQANEAGIRVINAQSKKDAYRVAIHLLEPDCDELEDALYRADRDLFNTIVVHTQQTWPMRKLS